MSKRIRAGLVTAAALSLAAATLGTGISAAGAYSGTPPWTANGYDTYAKGTLTFFDASGNQVTQGTDITALATYVSASTAARTNATKANLYYAFPDHSNAVPSTWCGDAQQQNYTFTTAVGVPAGVTTVAGGPFLKFSASGGDISGILTACTADTSGASYQNTLELRMKDSGVGVASDGEKYWRAVIEYNPDTALSAYDGLQPGEWRQLFPAPPVKTDTTASAVSMLDGVTAVSDGASVARNTAITLQATAAVSGDAATHPAGTLEFLDGDTVLGSSANYSTVTGVGAYTFTPDSGSHSFRARFTPTDGATYNGSSSTSSVSLTVQLAPGVSTLAPVITGAVRVGGTAVCGRGTWTGTGLTYRFVWKIAGVPFRDSGAGLADASYPSGALPAAYAGKALTCTVTASNSGGDVPATSSASTVALGLAARVVTGKAPSIYGKVKVGSVYVVKIGRKATAKVGTWSPTTTYTYAYQWRMFKKGKTGAYTVVSSRSYFTPTAAQRGKYVYLAVKALRTGYATGSASSLIAPIG